MKTGRAVVSGLIVGAVLIAFFVVPLPVSRVRQVGLVQLQDGAEHPVLLREDGRLEELKVQDGQFVHEGEVLARLRNRELEQKWDEAEAQCKILRKQSEEIARYQKDGRMIAFAPEQKEQLRTSLATRRDQTDHDLNKCEGQLKALQPQLDALTLRAPCDGWVINAPRPDEVGKSYDHSQPVPFCTVGAPDRLRMLVPVTPSDYRLLMQDREALKEKGQDLPITIRIQGRDAKTWTGGRLVMPQAEAKTIPPQLANKGGGPIPIKQGADPNKLEPVSQQYLLSIDIEEPDKAICPGSLGQAKIECRWRSAAWWVWRKINDTFDLGLM